MLLLLTAVAVTVAAVTVAAVTVAGGGGVSTLERFVACAENGGEQVETLHL